MGCSTSAKLPWVSSDHEPYAELAEPHRLALIRREHSARLLVHQFAHERPPLLISINTAFTELSAPYTYVISLSISFDIVFSEMAEKRKYEMKKRAERQRETRRRIIETTVELHRTRGPANTTISEIAQRAGVNRLTVYNHFPDVTDLLKACSRSWTERHPAPDPTPWAQISDPQVRLRTALTDLYSFYAVTEPMRANVLRDAQTMPELAALLEGSVVPYLGSVRDLLAEGWEVSDDGRKRMLATIKLAIDFHTWRSLERGSGLRRKEAVETMLEAVRSSVSRPGIP
jgi:AcrR family transcriptional regulator